MALPTSRAEFIALIKRQLGAPVQDIEMSDEQIDDQIDLALSFYADYHFDGTDKQYYKHQIDATDVTNRYITIPDNIIGVVNLFTIGDALNTSNMFSIRYQIALNDLYTLTNVSLVPYYMAMQHVRLIEEVLVGRQMIRFQRHMNRCYIDMDWTKLTTGDYLILECYQVIDPDTYTDVWKDRWLIEYVTALCTKQWAFILKKFDGMQLPGGVTFNAQKMFDEAEATIAKMRDEMINTYSLPVLDMVG